MIDVMALQQFCDVFDLALRLAYSSELGWTGAVVTVPTDPQEPQIVATSDRGWDCPVDVCTELFGGLMEAVAGGRLKAPSQVGH